MRLERRRKKVERRRAVRKRIRRRVHGTAERPRLSVFRSNRHLHLQLIDDWDGRTVASLSTEENAFQDEGFSHGGTVPAAVAAGTLLAERAKEAGVTRAVFDRGGYDYHGRVKAAAEAAREAGLEF